MSNYKLTVVTYATKAVMLPGNADMATVQDSAEALTNREGGTESMLGYFIQDGAGNVILTQHASTEQSEALRTVFKEDVP